MEGFRETVRGWIEDFIGVYCREHGEAPIWREPLVGLADANSPAFPELREVAYPGHRMPQDYLPNAVTVIAYFLPFSEELGDGNAEGEYPTVAWSKAYKLTNAMAKEMGRHIAAKVSEMGYHAVPPEDAGQIPGTTYSLWSQRHVARIAGLGSFGLNQLLITESGCCGRYFTVVTDVPCGHDAPFEGERCLYRIDGSCGLCADACPGRAITEDEFVRDSCGDRCDSNMGRTGGVSVCGKCCCGMPCSYTDPSA